MELPTDLVGATSTWEREAYRVGMLAADLGMPLDTEQLILDDVRDLVALCLRLQDYRRRSLRRAHRYGVRLA